METDAVRAGRLQPGCLLEGIGGGSGLSSGREVELELKLQEVEFTAARLGKELEEALGAQMVSEEQVVLLEQELKRRNDMVSDLKEQIGQFSLIKEDVKRKDNDESLRQLEEDLQTTKQKLRTGGEREIVLEGRLASEERKCKMLEEELLVKDKELKEGKNMRDEVERQLGELRREVQLLREKEAQTGVADLNMDESSNLSTLHDDTQSDKATSMIHDMSLDDGLVEGGKFLVRSSVSSLSLVEELVEVTGEEEGFTCSLCDDKPPRIPEEARQRLVKALHHVVDEEKLGEVNTAVNNFLEEVEGRGSDGSVGEILDSEDKWKQGNWLWVSVLLLLGLASFTFCGIKLNHTEYYPASWHGLR